MLVLIVDDSLQWMESVCRKLGLDPDVTIAGTASDGMEAVHKAQELRPDLILLDVNLPGMDGIKAAREIRKIAPRAAILIYER